MTCDGCNRDAPYLIRCVTCGTEMMCARCLRAQRRETDED